MAAPVLRLRRRVRGHRGAAVWVGSAPPSLPVPVRSPGVVATAGVSIFPFLLPSSTHPNSSLTVWDASSSHLTLFLMLIATAIFMPIILAYTTWVFHVLRGPVTSDYVDHNKETVY